MKNTSTFPEWDYQFIILGNSGNGKTTFLIRLEKDQFNVNPNVTVGVDYTYLKNKKLLYDNCFHKAVVWDTSGQQIYKAICGNYIHTSVGAFIALSLQHFADSDFNQFKQKTKKQLKDWLRFINNKTQHKNYSYHIIGTKLDYIQTQRHKQVQTNFNQWIKQALKQLQSQEKPLIINRDLIDSSVISAKLQVSSKQDIQNVLLKLIKTKYNADNLYGRQQKTGRVKIKPQDVSQNKNKRRDTKSKCC